MTKDTLNQIEILTFSISEMQEQKYHTEKLTSLLSQQIIENKRKLTEALRRYYSHSKLMGAKYLFNKPSKWGPLDTIGVESIDLQESLFLDGKILPYYTDIRICSQFEVAMQLSLEDSMKKSPEYQDFCSTDKFLVVSSYETDYGSHECYVIQLDIAL